MAGSILAPIDFIGAFLFLLGTRDNGSNGTGFRCTCRFNPRQGLGIVLMTNAASGYKLWQNVLEEVGDLLEADD